MEFANDLFVCRKFIPVTRSERCNCSLVNLMYFFEYNDSSSWSELVNIVVKGTIEQLRAYMELNKKVRIVDRHGNGPLHLSVIFNKMDVFDYLISLENTNINALNRYGHTCLHLAVINTSERVLKELIKRGADINRSDESCCTPLHTAASRFSSEMCRILLDNGANLDFQNLLGKTAIYHACQYGTIETIYMLMYYGANVTITDRNGILPFTVAMQQSLDCGDEIPQSHREMHEVLFNYTFEKKKITINLTTLTVAMKINSPLFPEILKKIDGVKYGRTDIIELSRSAIMIKPAYFKMFMRKHAYVVRDMLMNPTDLHHQLTLGNNLDTTVIKLMEFLTVIFDFRRTFNFLKGSTTFSYFIATLVSLHKDGKLSMEVLTEAVCFLYSYGLPVELAHMITIYENCGYCKLFKLLLTMEISRTYEQPKTIMPYLICDIGMKVDKFLNYVTQPCRQFRIGLRFFSSQRLRDLFETDLEMVDKIKNLPQVPSLIELSRDVARRHIIRKLKIKKTREFYRIMKRMPINEVYKKILIYERPLYNF